jgi:hypothetical protein
MPTEKKNQGQKWLPTLDSQVLAEATKNQRPNGMPSLGMIETELVRLGLSAEDARHVFDIWMMNGYTLRTGKKIYDWKAALRVWQRQGYFPSQKRQKDKGADQLARQQAAIDRMEERSNGSQP